MDEESRPRESEWQKQKVQEVSKHTGWGWLSSICTCTQPSWLGMQKGQERVWEVAIKRSEKYRGNPKAVFSYANSRMKTRSGIADIQTEEGTAVTYLEKSEALNDFFSSVFRIERDGPTPQLAWRDIN